MEATSLLGLCAVLLGGGAGFSLVQALGAHGKSRRRVSGPLRGSGATRFVSMLQRGFRPFKPLARKLLERSVVRHGMTDLIAMLERRFRLQERSSDEFDAVSVLSFVMAAMIVIGTAVSALTSSIVCGTACAACAVLLLFTRARTAEEKQGEAWREEVPEALRSMGVCFRSGLSLLQTLNQVAHELDGSLGTLFETAARRLEMGATTTEALKVFDTTRQVPELTFVAVALEAQHQSGGSIVTVLESAQESVESELELRRSLRVQTAQAKLSARIVTLMPFLLVAVFSLLSPGFLEPFFTSIPGMALLGLALGMQLAGTLLVHRMLRANTE